MSDSQSQVVRVQGFQKPQKAKKDGKPRKARRGWGAYRSVLNERSAAFNLTLDMQSLKQEVDNLVALRDILRSKTLVQSHSPDGSLMRVVTEFYRLFRHGGRMQQLGLKRLLDQDNQRDFMHSVMDVHMDVGNGLKGPDVMMQQMVMYSTVLSSVCLKMQSFDVVQAEDSVVVRTHSTLQFQIRRATIESVFPHVIHNEWLVQQLVGKEVEPKMDIAFYFNEAGKCVKYEVDLDFIGAFISIVQDPMVVNMLLGRALIADNCMLGVIDGPLEPEESAPLEEELRENVASGDQDKCLGVVEDYYLAFANDYQDYDSQHFTAPLQRNFLRRCANQKQVAERWWLLSKSFVVHSFYQKSMTSIKYNTETNSCIIRSSAKYTLRVTPATIQMVFPHAVDLCSTLIGKDLSVSSQIVFNVKSDTGCVDSIEEIMDFEVASAKIVENKHELTFLLSEALLLPDRRGGGGTSFYEQHERKSKSDEGKYGDDPVPMQKEGKPATR